MNENMSTAVSEAQPYGENTAEIKICDDAIRNAVRETSKLYELHEKYDNSNSVFYLHLVDKEYDRLSKWIMRRDALLYEAVEKGQLKEVPLWTHAL